MIALLHPPADNIPTRSLPLRFFDLRRQRLRLVRQVIPSRRHDEDVGRERARGREGRRDARVPRVEARRDVGAVEEPRQEGREGSPGGIGVGGKFGCRVDGDVCGWVEGEDGAEDLFSSWECRRRRRRRR